MDYILLSKQYFLSGVLLAVRKNHMYMCIVVGCIYGYLCGGICQGSGIVLQCQVNGVVLGVACHSCVNLTM